MPWDVWKEEVKLDFVQRPAFNPTKPAPLNEVAQDVVADHVKKQQLLQTVTDSGVEHSTSEVEHSIQANTATEPASSILYEATRIRGILGAVSEDASVTQTEVPDRGFGPTHVAMTGGAQVASVDLHVQLNILDNYKAEQEREDDHLKRAAAQEQDARDRAQSLIRHMEELTRMTQAAVLIQRYVRRFRERKAAARAERQRRLGLDMAAVDARWRLQEEKVAKRQEILRAVAQAQKAARLVAMGQRGYAKHRTRLLQRGLSRNAEAEGECSPATAPPADDAPSILAALDPALMARAQELGLDTTVLVSAALKNGQITEEGAAAEEEEGEEKGGPGSMQEATQQPVAWKKGGLPRNTSEKRVKRSTTWAASSYEVFTPKPASKAPGTHVGRGGDMDDEAQVVEHEDVEAALGTLDEVKQQRSRARPTPPRATNDDTSRLGAVTAPGAGPTRRDNEASLRGYVGTHGRDEAGPRSSTTSDGNNSGFGTSPSSSPLPTPFVSRKHSTTHDGDLDALGIIGSPLSLGGDGHTLMTQALGGGGNRGEDELEDVRQATSAQLPGVFQFPMPGRIVPLKVSESSTSRLKARGIRSSSVTRSVSMSDLRSRVVHPPIPMSDLGSRAAGHPTISPPALVGGPRPQKSILKEQLTAAGAPALEENSRAPLTRTSTPTEDSGTQPSPFTRKNTLSEDVGSRAGSFTHKNGHSLAEDAAGFRAGSFTRRASAVQDLPRAGSFTHTHKNGHSPAEAAAGSRAGSFTRRASGALDLPMPGAGGLSRTASRRSSLISDSLLSAAFSRQSPDGPGATIATIGSFTRRSSGVLDGNATMSRSSSRRSSGVPDGPPSTGRTSRRSSGVHDSPAEPPAAADGSSRHPSVTQDGGGTITAAPGSFTRKSSGPIHIPGSTKRHFDCNTKAPASPDDRVVASSPSGSRRRSNSRILPAAAVGEEWGATGGNSSDSPLHPMHSREGSWTTPAPTPCTPGRGPLMLVKSLAREGGGRRPAAPPQGSEDGSGGDSGGTAAAAVKKKGGVLGWIRSQMKVVMGHGR